ncbi:MAG: hypothetical protein DHS20C18_53540 [Saprospiraceae bacterium]|nr:MAG: hypothetical protein DHS20C18_53540 [Saprospiraceae bacterium]
MASFNQSIEKIAAARQTNATNKMALYAAKLKLQKAGLNLSANEIEDKLTAELSAEKESQEALKESIAELYGNNAPERLINNWQSEVPILLMPLRLETRFMPGENGKQELWLRIYPDDIAVQQHERLLTQREFDEGRNYWLQIFLAEKSEATEEAPKKAAWENLKNQFGANRSVWIARQTVPENWPTRAAITDAENLLFQEPELLKPDNWTQAPRTQALPDNFVVSIFKGSNKVHEQMGKPIPDTLYLGHDPFQAEAAFKKNEDGIEFAESFSWMADFDKAIEVGMGMKIKLKNNYFVNSSKQLLDKIVVLGLYLSADAKTSTEVLSDLMEGHRYSEGLAIIPQGTPTNNTEDAASRFVPNEDPQPKGYFEMPDTPAFTEDPLCDANRLSETLGIDKEVIRGIANSTSRDHAEAVKMNEALYPATIGYYFDTLLDKYVPDSNLPFLRDFFENHVTGAGPLPAIRIGNQPYGILPTSDFSHWVPEANDSKKGDFNTKLYRVLNYFHTQWAQKSEEVLFIGRERDHLNNILDPDRVFLDVVGLEPASVSFERRSGFLRDLPEFQTSWPQLASFRKEANENEQMIQTQFRVFAQNRTVAPTMFQQLLFRKENKVHIPEKNLIDGLPLSESRLLEEITAIKGNYLEWLSGISSVKMLEVQNFKGAKAPNYLLYLLARHAFLLELRRAAIDALQKRNGRIDRPAFDKTYMNFVPPDFRDALKNRDLTIWELLYADMELLDRGVPNPRIPTLGDHLLKQPASNTTFADIPKVRNAFAALSKIPTARLGRLLTGHLDSLTYRLDAWETALFYERLDSRRKDTTAPVSGTYLGAFGYLENLKPETRTAMTASDLPDDLRPANGSTVYKSEDNAGLLHAPSLDHAAAAALLMAGYRNHATPQEPGAFAVNLSSARIRRSTQILEGLRNGQQLEALLGYQFERACHDRTLAGENLNQFILAFRQTYPIENQYNPQEGETNTGEIFRQAPVNVVNGLKFSEEQSEQKIRNIMRAAVPTLPQQEIHRLSKLVLEEIEQLSDTLDALKDLMLSESVFQAASGNITRTGAVLEALREGELPPDPGILKTPRRSRFAFTNLMTVHFPQKSADSNPWGTEVPLTPRSRFESGLNSWLAEYLGDPATIVCKASHFDQANDLESSKTNITLKMLKIQAIDFVLFAGKDMARGETELERRIAHQYRQLVNLPADVKVTIHFSDKETGAGRRSFTEILPLAKALNAVLSSSRPVHAQDYAPFVSGQFSNNANPQAYDVSDLEDRVNQAILGLENALSTLENLVPNALMPKSEDNPATLKLLFEQWENANLDDTLFEGFPLAETAVDNIISARIVLSNFDIPGAWPLAVKTNHTAVLSEAARTWRSTNILKDNANILLTKSTDAEAIEEKVTILSGLAKLLLGGNFQVMPKFTYHNANDIEASGADRQQLLKYYANELGLPTELIPEDWLQSVSSVRSAAGRWELARSMAELQSGKDIPIGPIQLPYRPKDSWLAVQFPEFDETTGKPFGITTDTLSCTVFGSAAFETGSLQSGLLLDEWSETIPVDTETSGVAFNYNQPDTMPPQSILLAICPSTSDKWTWNALLETILDTFKRAKMRAVEPHQFVDNQLLNNFLPGIVAPINTKGNGISLDFAVASDAFLTKIPKNLNLYEAFVRE